MVEVLALVAVPHLDQISQLLAHTLDILHKCLGFLLALCYHVAESLSVYHSFVIEIEGKVFY